MENKLWGGRFDKKTDPLVEKFTKSIQVDKELALWDVLGSLTHVDILHNCGYLKTDEYEKLSKALGDIHKKILNNEFKPDLSSEDIHTCIQNQLEQAPGIGDLAFKLHTARSRNDQVVFATKLYSKSRIHGLIILISRLATALHELSEKYSGLIIPGFTHLQHAQPVYLKDYLGAYSSMLERDCNRLGYISDHIRLSMGAGALAGTPIPAEEFNKEMAGYISFLEKEVEYTKHLNLEVTRNSLDVVSDRDFVIEILNALSILGMHLSRFAEDFILWSTKEFGFIELDDSYCTGSSLMPQKKNPDVLELIRGYAGKLYGNLISVLTMMKGLPLTYNRDMQLDKEPLFNSFDLVKSELEVLEGLVKTIRFKKEKIAEHLKDESLYATDLVYYLVDKQVPFKEAHTIVGKLVNASLKTKPIKEMTNDELKQFSDKFEKHEILQYFDAEYSVKLKKSIKRDS